MKYNGMRPHDHAYKYELKRQRIRSHLLECYEQLVKYNNENKNANNYEKSNEFIKSLIKTHRNFIHKMMIYGNNQFITVLLLDQYKNAKNKSMAMMVLTNTLNRRGYFR